jgi:ammonia channel protein AmtB
MKNLPRGECYDLLGDNLWGRQMTTILVFYIIGGVIGVLITLRFLLPATYLDVKNAGYLDNVLKTIVYQLIRIAMVSCIAFFVSWISVGFFVNHYEDLKSELENLKRS